MTQKGQFEAHGIVTDVSTASGLAEALVAVTSDDFSGEGCKGIFA
jgi:hypothetical protein